MPSDIGYSKNSTTMITDAIMQRHILWQHENEIIVSVSTSAKHMVKIFEGNSANDLRTAELETKIPKKIRGLPAKRIDPLPIPNQHCCMLFSALPAGGHFLKPAGHNNNSQLDNIAEKIFTQFGIAAVKDVYVFDLTAKPKIIILSVVHFKF